MCTKNELQKILKDVILIYKEIYNKDLYKIYLYGSYARGEHKQDSDIDVVAIVKGNRENLQEKLKQVWDKSSDIELDYEVIISPTVIPYVEFQMYKDTLPYYNNILQEGVELSA